MSITLPTDRNDQLNHRNHYAVYVLDSQFMSGKPYSRRIAEANNDHHHHRDGQISDQCDGQSSDQCGGQ